MTYEEKLVWLNRYREARKELRHLQDQITEVQEQAEHTTRSISPAPGGSGGQALAVAVERKEELTRQADRLRSCASQYHMEISEALRRNAKNSFDYGMMCSHYLECRTWEQIADKNSFALRYIYTRRRKFVEQMDL